MQCLCSHKTHSPADMERGHCAVLRSELWWGILWNMGAQSWSPVTGGHRGPSWEVWNLSWSLGEGEGEGVLVEEAGGEQDHRGYSEHTIGYWWAPIIQVESRLQTSSPGTEMVQEGPAGPDRWMLRTRPQETGYQHPPLPYPSRSTSWPLWTQHFLDQPRLWTLWCEKDSDNLGLTREGRPALEEGPLAWRRRG